MVFTLANGQIWPGTPPVILQRILLLCDLHRAYERRVHEVHCSWDRRMKVRVLCLSVTSAKITSASHLPISFKTLAW